MLTLLSLLTAMAEQYLSSVPFSFDNMAIFYSLVTRSKRDFFNCQFEAMYKPDPRADDDRKNVFPLLRCCGKRYRAAEFRSILSWRFFNSRPPDYYDMYIEDTPQKTASTNKDRFLLRAVGVSAAQPRSARCY